MIISKAGLNCTFALITTLLAFQAAAVEHAYAHQRLYRTYNSAVTDNFYTISLDQRNLAINQHGYQDMGYVAYITSVNLGMAAPFYRFFKGAPQIEHFYTVSDYESSLVQSWGWIFEGNEGYLYTQQERNTSPLYRLAKFDHWTGDLQHAYTTSNEEMSSYISQGWGYDGPAGYVFAPPSPYASPNPSVHFVTSPSCFGSGCYQGYISVPAYSTGMYTGLCGGTVIATQLGNMVEYNNFRFQSHPYGGLNKGCFAPARLQLGTTLLEFSGYTVADYYDSNNPIKWVLPPSARLVNIR